MKKKILSAVLSALMAAQLFTAMGTATAAASSDWTPPLSIPREDIPEGDLIKNGHFTNAGVTRNFTTNDKVLEHKTDANGGYIEVSYINQVYDGVWFYPGSTIEAGKYKFTGYFRTAKEAEISMLQLVFYCKQEIAPGYYGDAYYNAYRPYVYIGNEWTKVEFYIELDGVLDYIRFRGGPYQECFQDFCLDNISIVPVDEIPEDFTPKLGNNLGLAPEKYAQAYLTSMQDSWKYKEYDPDLESQYEVGGIIVNYDITQYLSTFASNNYTEKDIINTALQYEGTQVTDIMINVASQGVVCYPSAEFEDYAEKYDITEIDGEPTKFQDVLHIKGAHEMYDVQGTDWVGLWTEYLPTIGINPWLSFRMNDMHTLAETIKNGRNSLLARFYYDNPQFYRVKHHGSTSVNSDYVLDYTYDETREMMLRMINDALNNYDCYSIELDYQREIFVFGIGGEYRGLDILNQFMRDVDDVVKVYEEKYGHDIKIGVRVAADIRTCYDFGHDVITWAAEDIVDLFIPTGRWASSVFDTPTRIWVTTMAPYDVEIAPCLEAAMRNYESGISYDRSFTLSTAFAANAFSQGADKIALYNYQPCASDWLGTAKKLSYNSDVWGHTNGIGAWNYLTTIGSYDKVMTVDRRHVLGWNDTMQIWHNDRNNQQFPKAVAENAYATIKIPIGDVAEGSTLTLKFSYDNEAVLESLPVVYANSKLCTYVGTEVCKGGATTDKLLCYEIPLEAHDDGQIVAEILSENAFTVKHAEVYIAVAPH